MNKPKNNQEDFKRLIFYCPCCRAKCQFKFAWHSNYGAQIDRIHGHITRYVLQCTSCEDYIFIQTKKVNEVE